MKPTRSFPLFPLSHSSLSDSPPSTPNKARGQVSLLTAFSRAPICTGESAYEDYDLYKGTVTVWSPTGESLNLPRRKKGEGRHHGRDLRIPKKVEWKQVKV